MSDKIILSIKSNNGTFTEYEQSFIKELMDISTFVGCEMEIVDISNSEFLLRRKLSTAVPFIAYKDMTIYGLPSKKKIMDTFFQRTY